MTTSVATTRRSLIRDPKGVAIHHVTVGISLYAHHGVANVLKADPRSLGRPPRVLCSVRLDVGFLDMVGLTSMDASLTIADALARSLARPTDRARSHAAGTVAPLGAAGGTVPTGEKAGARWTQPTLLD